MEKLLDLGEGLKIARAEIEELKEQDVNARSMTSAMFNRLTANIRQDRRLESLPFVAQTDRGLEIVSGHHRVRASRAAGLRDIYIILDDTGLDRNSIRSKQLSHNSLQGEDNRQLVREIYSMIDDAEKKLAAFVDPDVKDIFDKVRVRDVSMDMSIRSVQISFLRYEEKVFQECVSQLNDRYDSIYLADLKTLEPVMKAIRRINSEFDIRAMNTALYKMAEITLESLGAGQEAGEQTSLRDIFKTAYIPTEAADTIRQAISLAEEEKLVPKGKGWQLLADLCGNYLRERQ